MSSTHNNLTEYLINFDEYDYHKECKAAAKIHEQHLILCIVGSFGRTGGSLVNIQSK